jgi:hypothetical protein
MSGPGGRHLLLVFLIIFVIIVVVFVVFQKVAVFIKFIVAFGVFLVFVLFFLGVIGNGIERDRMRLRHFQLALALRAAQDLSLFHFVFVHIDFSGTFRTTEHVSILRFRFHPPTLPETRGSLSGVLYTRRVKSEFTVHAAATQCNSTSRVKE